MVPVYGTFSTSLPTKSIVEIIAAGVDDTRSAKLVPSQPGRNYAFMVDTSFLSNWKDVLSDDFGVWHNNGTKTYYYGSTFKETGQVTATKIMPIPLQNYFMEFLILFQHEGLIRDENCSGSQKNPLKNTSEIAISGYLDTLLVDTFAGRNFRG